jgi:hypothetical protein
MRKLAIAAIAATAAFTSLAHAGGNGAVNTVTATDTTVQVQGVRYKMDAKEFADFKGSYAMADGSTLTLSNSKNKFYASVDGKKVTEIVPVASNAFSGRNGDIKISFDEFRDGRVHDVVLAR